MRVLFSQFKIFQSTPPSLAETKASDDAMEYSHLKIHSAIASGDKGAKEAVYIVTIFQSTPPSLAETYVAIFDSGHRYDFNPLRHR